MEITPPYNEKILLAQIAGDDEAAFGELFRTHWDHVYSVAYGLLKSSSLAEDIVQEVFVRIWTHRKQLPDIENFDNYLFIVARNLIFSELKKKGRKDSFIKELMAFSEETRLNPEQQLIQKQASELIHAAIDRLPQQQKTVYKLAREKGMKYEEIAQQLNISRNTVRIHLVVATKSIRKYLQENSKGALLLVCLFDAVW